MDDLLLKRVDDLFDRAEKGIFAYGDFLNETEAAYSLNYALKRKADYSVRLWGGFADSERKRLFIYPDYYEFEDNSDCISAVEMQGSGYAELKHSSFLGALTSLGIDRAKMGDIVISGNSGILFADKKICEFLLSSPAPLTRVGRDSIKTVKYIPTSDFEVKREFEDIRDTIASPRLDAAVGALCNLSREKAKALVLCSSVFINHIPCERPDALVNEGDILTVRGKGKFIIISLSDKTKKDRYRLTAKKYK